MRYFYRGEEITEGVYWELHKRLGDVDPDLTKEDKTKSRLTLEEKFWAKVGKDTKSGCWEWLASKIHSGYGRIKLPGKHSPIKLAHRVSWELHNGPIPDGLWVLHKCDNPSCVNPDHLFLGTHQDNIDDMVRKGRHNYKITPKQGEEHHNSKLTHGDVLEIIKLGGILPNNIIAKMYNVNSSHICNILKRRGRIHDQ